MLSCAGGLSSRRTLCPCPGVEGRVALDGQPGGSAPASEPRASRWGVRREIVISARAELRLERARAWLREVAPHHSALIVGGASESAGDLGRSLMLREARFPT